MGIEKEYYSSNISSPNLKENSKIKFDGEYINGKMWKGKGYDINGNLIFELKKGKGTMKEIDINGNVIFEGEYLNGEKHNGKGN